MIGGLLFLALLSPFLVAGLVAVVIVRLRLVWAGGQALLQGNASRLRGAPLFALAAGNVVIAFLANTFGVAAFAVDHLGFSGEAALVFHGANVAQGMLGLAVLALWLSRWDES